MAAWSSSISWSLDRFSSWVLLNQSQFSGNLYEQTDGVMMRSLLGPLLANVFMCSIEDKLDQDGKLPSYYRRYVDDTFTIMPDIASAEIFLDTLNHCHPSAKFTMEVERNTSLPFIGVELLIIAPRIKTKVYVKPIRAFYSTTRANG